MSCLFWQLDIDFPAGLVSETGLSCGTPTTFDARGNFLMKVLLLGLGKITLRQVNLYKRDPRNQPDTKILQDSEVIL